MALFVKKNVPVTLPRYTIGQQSIKLIVALGNPGNKYADNRHNAGFIVVDDYARQQEFNQWVEKKDLKAVLCAKIAGSAKIILCKPTTYMNLSGEALRATAHYFKVPEKDICVIHDELDLPLGTIRTGAGGSDAGHNGIKSCVEHSENKFWRIRIGIGSKQPPEIDSADYVLQDFSASEQGILPSITKEVTNLISDWLSGSATPDTRKL